MKIRLIYSLYLISFQLFAQTAFHNFGAISIHENGKVGFHTNLINDGNFYFNKGFEGIYSDKEELYVSGINKIRFNNFELDVSHDLKLYTSLDINGDMLFTSGRVITPRDNDKISFNYKDDNIYAGVNNSNYIDGYATVSNSSSYILPVGDKYDMRSIKINVQSKNSKFKGAYFFENPNFPDYINNQFSTDKKQLILSKINDVEFWYLSGTEATEVTLSWDPNSKINQLTSDVNNLRIVGWDKTKNKWTNLGNKVVQGNLSSGTITSKKFNPNNYASLTLGTIATENPSKGNFNVEYHNFGISPNGDGINDVFVIEGLDLSLNNTLKIFNRWGALVYHKKNYKNNWDGRADNTLTLEKSKKLPSGTYFYVITFAKIHKKWRGYIYLNR